MFSSIPFATVMSSLTSLSRPQIQFEFLSDESDKWENYLLLASSTAIFVSPLKSFFVCYFCKLCFDWLSAIVVVGAKPIGIQHLFSACIASAK